MSSNVNPYNVDGTYPIAGQDNDSQGFRDNFTNIRTNLTFVKEELEDLQNKAVLKTALAGGSLDNTFVNVLFTGVKAKAFTEVQYDFGSDGGAINLQFTNGQCQTMSTNAPVTLGFSSWPAAGMHAKIRLWIDVTSLTHTLLLPPAVTIGKEEIQGLVGQTITFKQISTGDPSSNVGLHIFEFTTVDGGVNIAIEEITSKLQRIKLIAPPVVNTGAVGDLAGNIAYDDTGTAGYIYVCIADYDAGSPAAVIWTKTAMTAWA